MDDPKQKPRQADEDEPVEDLEAPAEAQEDVAGGQKCEAPTCYGGHTCVNTLGY